MSTRSMIAIKQADGTIKGMWKHWDGYPSYMCEMLYAFQSRELAEELVGFGSCESIVSKDYILKNPDMYEMDKLTELSNGYYINMGKGEPVVYSNCEECFREDIEYLYVWDEWHGWIVVDGGIFSLFNLRG